MILAFLLAASALLAQNVPALTNQNGTIVGVLRNAAGAPATGVRVSAMARPDSVQDLLAASAFAALAETDSAGRYRLENVPPGRYYIVAGRVDAPTYYPGTIQPADGTVVQITPGASISGIDFVLNNGSVGRANTDLSGFPSWVVPIQIGIDGGGKIPVFSAGKFPVLRFARYPAQNEVSLNAPSVTLLEPSFAGGPPQSAEYRVTLVDLPDSYELKSLTFGFTDLLVDAMQLPKINSGSTVTQPVLVKLAVRTSTPPGGARISGRIQGNARRSVYISGNAGTVYIDGTFEFIGVPPGRHIIVSHDSPITSRSTGATLIVGDQDLDNIELEEVSVPPANSNRPVSPTSAGNRLPGSRIPLLSIHGRVSAADSLEPYTAGKVILNGNYSSTFSLGEDGGFNVPKLLPGTYDVDVIVYGIGGVSRTVVIDEQDSTIELILTP